MIEFVDAVYATTDHSHATLLWSPNLEALDCKGKILFDFFYFYLLTYNIILAKNCVTMMSYEAFSY